MSAPVPGWYADPNGGPSPRWWDGSQWTASTLPADAVSAGQQQGIPAGIPAQLASSAATAPPIGTGSTGDSGLPNPVPPPTYGAIGSGANAVPGQSPYGLTGQPSYPAPGQSPYPPPGQTPYGLSGQPSPGSTPSAPKMSALQHNKFSLVAIGMSVVYGLIAVFASFVIFGFVPIVMTLRAFRAKEPYAPVAAVLSVATVIFGIYMRTR